MTVGADWAKSDAFWLMRNNAQLSRFGRSFAFVKKGLRFGAVKAMPVDFATIDDPINRAALGCFNASKAENAELPYRLTVSLIRCSEIDDAFRDEWRALEDSSLNPNPYFAHWFLEPAMRHLDPAEEVRIVALRRAENSMLVALAPFVFQKGYAKLPLKHVCVWTHAHCFNGAPLIREGFSVAAYSALFDWVDTRPEDSVFIRFAMLPFDGETRNAIDEACALRDRNFRVQDYYERAVLTADNDFDTVVSSGRSLKENENSSEETPHSDGRSNVELTALPIEKSDVLTDFISLENTTWKNPDPESLPLEQSTADALFFREAMEAGEKEGAVRCLAAVTDGEQKAMLFTMQLGSRLSAFKMAYDNAADGLTIRKLLMETAAQQMPSSSAGIFDSCARKGHSVADDFWSERLPIVQINIPTKRTSDKILLRISATLEKIKLKVLRAVSGKFG